MYISTQCVVHMHMIYEKLMQLNSHFESPVADNGVATHRSTMGTNFSSYFRPPSIPCLGFFGVQNAIKKLDRPGGYHAPNVYCRKGNDIFRCNYTTLGRNSIYSL